MTIGSAAHRSMAKSAIAAKRSGGQILSVTGASTYNASLSLFDESSFAHCSISSGIDKDLVCRRTDHPGASLEASPCRARASHRQLSSARREIVASTTFSNIAETCNDLSSDTGGLLKQNLRYGDLYFFMPILTGAPDSQVRRLVSLKL